VGNFYVFGKPSAGLWTGQRTFAGISFPFALPNLEGNATLAASFPDGTSNVLLFSERRGSSFGCGINTNTPSLWAHAGDNTQTSVNKRPSFCDYPDQLNGTPTLLKDMPICQGFQTFEAINANPAICNTYLASSFHIGGIPVCLVDGSVRFISNSISPDTWTQAVQPADGAVLNPDW
jgi:hypothetical protein